MVVVKVEHPAEDIPYHPGGRRLKGIKHVITSELIGLSFVGVRSNLL
jgi:hypothetical protein